MMALSTILTGAGFVLLYAALALYFRRERSVGECEKNPHGYPDRHCSHWLTEGFCCYCGKSKDGEVAS